MSSPQQPQRERGSQPGPCSLSTARGRPPERSAQDLGTPRGPEVDSTTAATSLRCWARGFEPVLPSQRAAATADSPSQARGARLLQRFPDPRALRQHRLSCPRDQRRGFKTSPCPAYLPHVTSAGVLKPGSRPAHSPHVTATAVSGPEAFSLARALASPGPRGDPCALLRARSRARLPGRELEGGRARALCRPVPAPAAPLRGSAAMCSLAPGAVGGYLGSGSRYPCCRLRHAGRQEDPYGPGPRGARGRTGRRGLVGARGWRC